jgi:hypothetical protein
MGDFCPTGLLFSSTRVADDEDDEGEEGVRLASAERLEKQFSSERRPMLT